MGVLPGTVREAVLPIHRQRPSSIIAATVEGYGAMKTKQSRTRAVGSPPSATQEPNLVPLSCPDCFGVLRFEREGAKGHLTYRCQVDHRYSPSSLLYAKETQLERTLWSAALLLKQMAYAYQDLLEEMPKTKGVKRTTVSRRIGEVKKHCRAIQAMIENTHVPQ